MTKEIWYSLDIREQLSNVHGEVVRMIRSRNNYQSGRSKKDYTKSHMDKVHELVSLTCSDPKNIRRQREILDEESEIGRWYEGQVDDAYILKYWEQYTKAIS